MAITSCISTGKLEYYYCIAFDVFFFWFQVYEVEHCLCCHFTKTNFVRFETMIWPSIQFIKSLDIFWSRLERSRSEEYLDYFEIKVVKRSFERCSCLEFILKNSNRNTAKICKVLIMTQDFQRHFSFNTYISSWINIVVLLNVSLNDIIFLSWCFVTPSLSF